MARTFAIGDIHGCADELSALLDHIRPDGADTVVFLGDYIDRGPSPKDVVERLLQLEHEGPHCVFLKGNHEDMFLDFIGLGGHYGDAFLYNGGSATLRSYGLPLLLPDQARDQMPADHLDFYRRLKASHTSPGFFFAHAGIRPGRPLDSQSEEDLFWIREEFVRHAHDLGSVVVFGHTPQREVLVHLPYKIGLDTGLVYGNKLSCLEVGGRLFQIRRGKRQVEERALAL